MSASARRAPGTRAAHPALVLKAGREKSLLRRHPWIFTGVISVC